MTLSGHSLSRSMVWQAEKRLAVFTAFNRHAVTHLRNEMALRATSDPGGSELSFLRSDFSGWTRCRQRDLACTPRLRDFPNSGFDCVGLPRAAEVLEFWRNVRMAEVSPGDHFVCVQSVVADRNGSLWVVDPAAPNAEKTIKGGPKVVEIDLKSNTVKRVFPMSADVAGPASYLNDIRIAPDGRFAYLTDSGSPGGLVVLDIPFGKAWRVLSDDPSTQFDLTVTVVTNGQPLKRPDGRQPLFNADSLALSKDGSTLYWQALTGKTLYKILASSIQSAAAAAQARPEKVATTEPVDGLWMGENGEIYLSSIADNAVKAVNASDGSVRQLLKDSRLRWPDTFSQGPDGAIYVTASHIQDSPWFHMGWTDKSFTLFKFMLAENNTVGTRREPNRSKWCLQTRPEHQEGRTCIGWRPSPGPC